MLYSKEIESIQKLKYYLISETCFAVPSHCASTRALLKLSLSWAGGLHLFSQFVQRWTSVFACLIWECVLGGGKLKLMVYLWFRKYHTDIVNHPNSPNPPFN